MKEKAHSEEDYTSAIQVLNNAFDFLDGFVAAHKLNGDTLMQCAHIIMSTHGPDQFVGRVLRSTNPPSVNRHSFLNNWWVENARPEFARRRLAAEREARTKEREEREHAVYEKRRCADAEASLLPSTKVIVFEQSELLPLEGGVDLLILAPKV